MQHDNMPCIKIESRINMNSVRSKSGVRVLSTEEPGFPGLAPLLRLSWRLGSPSNLAAASRHRRSRARVTHHRAGDEHDNEMLLDHVLFCLVSRNKCFYVHNRQYSLNVRRPRQLQNGYFYSLLTWMQTLWLVSCISQIIIRISFVSFCLCLLFKHLCSCSVSSINMKGLISFYMFVDLCL